jgi:hypothetical protein
MKVYKFPTPDRIEHSKKRKVVKPVLSNEQLTVMQHEQELEMWSGRITRFTEELRIAKCWGDERYIEKIDKLLWQAKQRFKEQQIKYYRAKESV